MKIKVPILNIETIAKDEEDAKIAIVEAVLSFAIASERFGEGIEKELGKLNKKLP